MFTGLIDLPWWGYVVAALVLTHITIAAVTIYLHRHQAHRALDLHPVVSHFFRFWLWFTTGMITKEWAAIHRKHHAKVETPDDPHSPQQLGIRRVLWTGAELYRDASRNRETMEKYGHGTPDDWLERHLYVPHTGKGIVLMLVINLALFGPLGLTIWAVQMAWIPIFAAGVINGIGHYWGYRNYEVHGRLDQHRAVGHPHRRRGAAQQPPHLRQFRQAVLEMVGIRHRLALHPRPRNRRVGAREEKSRPSSPATPPNNMSISIP